MALKVLSQNYFAKPYKENIENLVTLCRENGIQPILILLPPSLGSFAISDENHFLPGDLYFQEGRKIMPMVQSRLMEIQKNISLENNVPIIDISYMFDDFKTEIHYIMILFISVTMGIM
jgi:hypothetical protein